MSGIERYVAGERASCRTSVGDQLWHRPEGVTLPFGVEVHAEREALGGRDILFRLLFGDLTGLSGTSASRVSPASVPDPAFGR